MRGGALKQGRVTGIPGLTKLRRSRLTDEDHRINAIAQLGGVVRVLRHSRGVLIESFRTMDGADCTQNIDRLQRADLVNPYEFPRDITESAMQLIATMARVPTAKRAKRKRKP